MGKGFYVSLFFFLSGPARARSPPDRVKSPSTVRYILTLVFFALLFYFSSGGSLARAVRSLTIELSTPGPGLVLVAFSDAGQDRPRP